MSWFMAAIYDRFMRGSERAGLDAWRQELLRDVAGDVLEVGAGTGANLAHYPGSIRRLTVTEPDRAMRRQLDRRLRHTSSLHSSAAVAAQAEHLPFADASFDAVVATLVFCSVEDPARAIREVRRVLRPGGRFYFLEHVESDRPSRVRWQHRVEPVWKRVADNCHLTRRTEETIVAAGFTLDWVKRESMRKAMPIVRATVRGVARAPGAA